MTQIATIEQKNDFEVLVDPKDFGIETVEDKRVHITDVFAFYENEYNQIVSATQITPELSEQSSSLRKKVAKIRIAIAKIHKAKKEQFLHGGRLVDNWKNVNSEIVEQKEKKLLEIETHFQRIEQDRIAKMRESRIEILKQYEVDGTLIPTIAIMDESTWESFLMGEKLKFEAKQEQIKKELEIKAEQDRKVKLYSDRKEQLIPFWNYLKHDHKSADFGELPQESFDIILNEVKETKRLADAVEEETRLENERLKAEVQKQKEEADAKLKKEQEEKAKIQAELKAKQDAEAKAKADEEARIEAEANMGDKEKVQSLIQDLGMIKVKYQFKSKKNQKMFSDVQGLIDKLINHIQK